VYSEKTPDDGQINCPIHVGFFVSKNKFEKLVHLVGFITRIYHHARSPERQIKKSSVTTYHLCRVFGLSYLKTLRFKEYAG